MQDYIWAGIFKGTFFALRFLSVILIAEMLDTAGPYLLLQFLIELLRIVFDAGLETRILTGLATKVSVSSIVVYRLVLTLLGQLSVLAVLVALGTDSDDVFLICSAFSFSVLMVYGYVAGLIQSRNMFNSFIKKNIAIFFFAVLSLACGFLFNNVFLLILPELIFVLGAVLFIMSENNRQTLGENVSFFKLLAGSKDYALNSFFSAWYTRCDAVIIFIYSLEEMAVEYMLGQRYVGLPLFVVSILSSLFLTKASSDIRNIKRRNKIMVPCLLGCIFYIVIMSAHLKLTAVLFLISALTILRIINSFLTASIIAINEIEFIRRLSGWLTVLSIALIPLYTFSNSLLYIPAILFLSEALVFFFTSVRLRRYAY